MDSLYEMFQSRVLGWLASMKHPAFRSEKEWRLILDVYESAELEYLEKSTMITRHFPVSFLQLHDKYKLLPIREILVGPSRHPEVSRETIGKMLTNSNYYGYLGWQVEINMSGIPFQVP